MDEAVPIGRPPGYRPTVATIDLAALRHNYEAMARACGVAMMPVVKADAYGLGGVPCARELVSAGAGSLAVALVEEGLELRAGGIGVPILLLGGVPAAHGGAEACCAARLSVAVWDSETVSRLSRAAASSPGRAIGVHVKIDTGMGRMGVAAEPAAVRTLALAIAQAPAIRFDGIMTHLPEADEDSVAARGRTDAQLARFESLVEEIRSTLRQLPGGAPVAARLQIHAANSAGAVGAARGRYPVHRVGIALYGARSGSRWDGPELLPVVSWHTAVAAVRSLPAGSRVSYGGRWQATRVSRIATLPVGYADGYARSLEGNAQVVVRGRRAPVIGAICMDLIMVDVTDIPEVGVGEPVTLLGDGITTEEMAHWSGTIPYEVTTRISARVPRRWVGGSRG